MTFWLLGLTAIEFIRPFQNVSPPTSIGLGPIASHTTPDRLVMSPDRLVALIMLVKSRVWLDCGLDVGAGLDCGLNLGGGPDSGSSSHCLFAFSYAPLGIGLLP